MLWNVLGKKWERFYTLGKNLGKILKKKNALFYSLL